MTQKWLDVCFLLRTAINETFKVIMTSPNEMQCNAFSLIVLWISLNEIRFIVPPEFEVRHFARCERMSVRIPCRKQFWCLFKQCGTRSLGRGAA